MVTLIAVRDVLDEVVVVGGDVRGLQEVGLRTDLGLFELLGDLLDREAFGEGDLDGVAFLRGGTGGQHLFDAHVRGQGELTLQVLLVIVADARRGGDEQLAHGTVLDEPGTVELADEFVGGVPFFDDDDFFLVAAGEAEDVVDAGRPVDGEEKGDEHDQDFIGRFSALRFRLDTADGGADLREHVARFLFARHALHVVAAAVRVLGRAAAHVLHGPLRVGDVDGALVADVVEDVLRSGGGVDLSGDGLLSLVLRLCLIPLRRQRSKDQLVRYLAGIGLSSPAACGGSGFPSPFRRRLVRAAGQRVLQPFAAGLRGTGLCGFLRAGRVRRGTSAGSRPRSRLPSGSSARGRRLRRGSRFRLLEVDFFEFFQAAARFRGVTFISFGHSFRAP